jgi:hypothetical protein
MPRHDRSQLRRLSERLDRQLDVSRDHVARRRVVDQRLEPKRRDARRLRDGDEGPPQFVSGELDAARRRHLPQGELRLLDESRRAARREDVPLPPEPLGSKKIAWTKSDIGRSSLRPALVRAAGIRITFVAMSTSSQASAAASRRLSPVNNNSSR